jgi:hypothetical protein
MFLYSLLLSNIYVRIYLYTFGNTCYLHVLDNRNSKVVQVNRLHHGIDGLTYVHNQTWGNHFLSSFKLLMIFTLFLIKKLQAQYRLSLSPCLKYNRLYLSASFHICLSSILASSGILAYSQYHIIHRNAFVLHPSSDKYLHPPLIWQQRLVSPARPLSHMPSSILHGLYLLRISNAL